MAFDAYAVAVKITLANHVSGGLKIVRDELQSTGFEVGRLNTKLEFLAKNARGAWAALRSGRDIASVFRGPANDAANYQRELDKLHRTLAKPFAPVVIPSLIHPVVTPPGGGGAPPITPIPVPGAHGAPHSPLGVAGAYHAAMAGMMNGGMMLAGGLAIAGAMKGPLDEAMQYQREMAKLGQQGLGAAQIAEAQKFAQANKIIGTSLLDRTKMFTDAQGSFRESGLGGSEALAAAKLMSPVLARYQVANSLLNGGHQEMAHAQFQNLNKTVELLGGLTDPARAAMIADGVFKASQSSGKMVSERDLKQFMSHGGVAVSSLTPKTIFAGLEPVIGALGGSSVATGMMTAYSRANGMMALTPSIMTNEALRLGMWDAGKVTRTKGGGARFEHGSPMTPELAKLMDTDTVGFAQKMMEIYAKNGITALADMGRENNILFGRNGGKIYTQIMQQMPVLLHSEQAYDRALGISQTIDQGKDGPTMKMLQFHKAVDDLSLAVGNGLIPVLMPMVTGLTSLAQELGRHPTLIKGLTYSLVTLGGFLATGGLINMIISAGRGFMLVGTALRAGFMFALPTLARFATYAFMFGRALMVTPIGLIVTGIAAAAYLLWNNWKEVKGSLFVMWGDIKTGFKQFFSGDIMGALKSFAHAWLLSWQTIFNTLIAGVNKILPSGMALNKLSFADRPAVTDMMSGGGQRLVAPLPPRPSLIAQLTQPIHLDGKKIAEVVTGIQTREMSKPQTSSQGFDLQRSPILPSSSSLVYPRG